MTSLLGRHAAAAAAAGWPVFPVAPGEKRPAVKNWETAASTDPAQTAATWTRADYNIGIAAGPAGLLVVDLDVPKPGEPEPPGPGNRPGITTGADVLAALADQAGQAWPVTRSVRTPTGGLHLYFAAPAGLGLRNTQGRLGWKIDTRAAGGYILAAGSTTPAGTYTLLDDRAVAPLPGWLGTRLTPPPARPPAPLPPLGRDRLAAYAAAAVRGETDRVRTASRGRHNLTLYLAAINLGQLTAAGALDPDCALDALRRAAEHLIAAPCDCSPRDIEATIASGLRTGARRPRNTAA